MAQEYAATAASLQRQPSKIVFWNRIFRLFLYATIGVALVEHLARSGHDVTVVARRPRLITRLDATR